MKKRSFLFGVISLLLLAGVISCEKKKSNGITPTYGATGNPNPGDQTVTGTTTYTNPATENTSLFVGGSGWTNPTCGSTNSLTLKGFNGSIEVTLTFASAIRSNTYAIASTPSGTTACALTVRNAPNQPAGVVWYGKSGSVAVTTSSSAINANFVNSVICAQQNFNFPTVAVSGGLGCSQ